MSASEGEVPGDTVSGTPLVDDNGTFHPDPAEEAVLDVTPAADGGERPEWGES